MIVGTRSTSVYLRKFSNKVAISKINNMLPELLISPEIHHKQVFVFSNDDLKARKVADEFREAVQAKDPEIIVVVLDKKGKSQDIGQLPGVDYYIEKPDPDKVTNLISSAIEGISEKKATQSSADRATPIVEFTPDTVDRIETVEKEKEESEEEDIWKEQKIEELSIVKEIQETKEQVAVATEHTLESRVRDVNKVADLTQLTKEISMSQVLKDIAKENHEYKSLVDRLSVLDNTIQTTMIQMDMPIEQRLEKVRAYTIDQQVYRTQASNIIEEKIQSIVLAITTKASEVVKTRLNDIDKNLVRLSSPKDVDFNRVAGLLDERNSVFVELAVMDKEVREIFYKLDELTTSTVAEIGDSSANLTKSPLLNAKLRTMGINNISGESLETIHRMILTLDRTSEQFKSLVSDIKLITSKLYKLLEIDQELIMAQQEVIKWLQLNKVEDTVVALDMLKKSLRVFTGYEGAGVTTASLILSHLKSRTSSNVLLLDLRRNPEKYEECGVKAITLREFLETPIYNQMCIVTSEESDILNEGMDARLEVELSKAADYYRVINIVVDPEDIGKLPNTIANSLVVNYIVDTNKNSLRKMAKVIKELQLDNVARRVIINKTMEVKPILDRLGLEDSIDIGVLTVPYIEQLPSYSLLGVSPLESTAIVKQFEEASKYA